MEAAAEANAHKFISALPDGYRTVVGEGGAAIWGAEAEGGNSARTDQEAGGAAAGRGDKRARRGVRALGAGGAGTTVTVAHRLSTVRGADTIAVVEEGWVVEKGSHSQLLAQNPDGSYARMIQLQLFSSV